MHSEAYTLSEPRYGSQHAAHPRHVPEASAGSFDEREFVYNERGRRSPSARDIRLVAEEEFPEAHARSVAYAADYVEREEPEVASVWKVPQVETRPEARPRQGASRKQVEPMAETAPEPKASVAVPAPEITRGVEPPHSVTKPPRVGVNIEWVQKGVGWDCREVYYVGKQRRRRHLGHIGRQKWEEMKDEYAGKELERVLSEWIEARRAEKSLSLNNDGKTA